MRAALAFVAVAAACAHARHDDAIATPRPGVSIAVYQRGAEDDQPYAVIDDRRQVTVAGTTLTLEDIDPAAAMPSLVIESLGAQRLAVGACTRERLVTEPTARDALAEFGRRQERLARERAWTSTHTEPFPERDDRGAAPTTASPTVRCAVSAAPGSYLVRVLYVTSSIRYRVQHDVSMSRADRATLTTRFSVVPTLRGGPADVRLFDGKPGGSRAPREVAHGTIPRDGSTSVLLAAPRELPVQLRRVFAGALNNGVTSSSDLMWGRDSTQAVWVWLEIADLRLAPGPVHAHVAIEGEAERDVDVPASGLEQARTELRVPLWIDEQLRGQRVRTAVTTSSEHIVERLQLSIANVGSVAREVWIEEPLRDARARHVVQAWPLAPALVRGRAQLKTVVPPTAIQRTGFTIAYDL